jgi:hypothetical protein
MERIKRFLSAVWKFCSFIFVPQWGKSPTRADKTEWAGASATGLSARGAKGSVAR